MAEENKKVKKKKKKSKPGMGHNNPPSSDAGTKEVGGVAGDRLRSFLERVERLEEEKTALSEDIKEVYKEAKSAGFEVKILRKIIRLRKMDVEKRSEERQLLELYTSAIGMD